MAQTLRSEGEEGIELPIRIMKSSGTSEAFDIKKLELAITQSLGDCKDSIELHKVLLETVLKRIEGKITTSTHFINDIIEIYLLRNKYYDVLQKYINNRLEKNKVYTDKVNLLGSTLVTDPSYNKKELDHFSLNQIQIAANRYLQRDMKTGDIVESMTGWFDRVASHVVLGSVVYDPEVYILDQSKTESFKYEVNEKPDHLIVKFGYLTESQVNVLDRLWEKQNYEGRMKLGKTEFMKKVSELLRTDKYQSLYRKYFQYMYEGIFEPNTPTLMNAGTERPRCSACFVLYVQDNMEYIGSIWRDAALIYQGAGGFGTNVSDLRPKGSNVGRVYGAASGPINLILEMIDKVTDVVKSGGARRGANMAIMDYNYPQIEEFINMKKKPGYLENFNISVMFDEHFWKYYHSGTDYELLFQNKGYGRINARNLMENIAVSAWTSAEPGVLFKDNANRRNPLKLLKGELKATNPCSEQYLYDGESCTLGSINLAKLVREDNTFDLDRYVTIIHETTRFLNDVLEINEYPTPHIEQESNKVRRIGLGIMGLADLLLTLKIPYNSQEGFEMMEKLSKILYIESVKASIDLAEERGSCTYYNEYLKYEGTPAGAVNRSYGIEQSEPIDVLLGTDYTNKLIKHGIRNMWTTTIAPTGTISMIANCSSGLEPIFALVFSKITTAGKYYYTSELFEKALIDAGIYSQELIEKVERNYGSCQGIDEIPKDIQKVFLTAMDLHWIDHVVAQSVWQNWIDNSISKTVNMPYNVTVDDVKNAYILAHELGLKGIALFRDGSRNEQVLHVGSNVQSNKNEQNVQADIPGTQTIPQAPTRNQVEKKVVPSRFSMNYIRDRVNEQLMTELTIHAGKKSTYMEEKGDECPLCKEMTLINEGGCSSCRKCGFASCSVA